MSAQTQKSAHHPGPLWTLALTCNYRVSWEEKLHLTSTHLPSFEPKPTTLGPISSSRFYQEFKTPANPHHSLLPGDMVSLPQGVLWVHFLTWGKSLLQQVDLVLVLRKELHLWSLRHWLPQACRGEVGAGRDVWKPIRLVLICCAFLN